MAAKTLAPCVLLVLAATALSGCVSESKGEDGPSQVITFTGGEKTEEFSLEKTPWLVGGSGNRTVRASCTIVCQVQEALGLGGPTYTTYYTFQLEGLPRVSEELGYELVLMGKDVQNKTVRLFRPDDDGKYTPYPVEVTGNDTTNWRVLVYISYPSNTDTTVVVAQGNFTTGSDSMTFSAVDPGERLFGLGKISPIDGKPDTRRVNVTLYGVWRGVGFNFEAWFKGVAADRSLGFFNVTTSTGDYYVAAEVLKEELKSFSLYVTLEPKDSAAGVASNATVLQSVFVL